MTESPMTKHQTPHNHQGINHQSPNRLVIGELMLGVYLMFGMWCLDILR